MLVYYESDNNVLILFCFEYHELKISQIKTKYICIFYTLYPFHISLPYHISVTSYSQPVSVVAEFDLSISSCSIGLGLEVYEGESGR